MSITPNHNYAPQKEETATQYSARIQAAGKEVPRQVVQAAQIIATAMEMGLYEPYAEGKDSFAQALDHITESLRGFSSTQNLAGARDDLMDAAIDQIKQMTGRKINANVARRLIAGKADTDLTASLGVAVGKSWADIKEASGLGDQNVSNKKIVDSYKDEVDGRLVESDLSRLVQQVYDLRESLRGQGQGGGKPRKR